MDAASNTSSLSWTDYMMFRIVSETSETRQSLDEYGVEYFLKLYEAITLKEYLDSLRLTDIEIKRENANKKPLKV